MAERATAANVAAHDTVAQKYHSALNILRTDIDRAKSQQSKAGGEASQAYSRIEKLGVNKKAATFIASLLKTERSIAEDVMRSVINLAQVAGMMPQEDLVDLADRLADSGGVRSSAAAGSDDDEQNDDDTGGDDDAVDDEEGEAPAPESDEVAAPDGDQVDPMGGDADQAAAVIHDTSQPEWDAAGEAAAAKAKVGKQPTPAEARAARKRSLRSVPEAMGAAVH